MKKAGFLAAIALCAALPAVARDVPLFGQANAKYQSGDFKAAAGLYEELLKSGKNTAAIHYNLGSAYFKLKRYGRALLEFERAKKALPRDKDIRWNLEVLKAALPDRVAEESGVAYYVRRLTGLFSLDEAALAVTALLAALAALHLLAFLAPASRRMTAALRGLLVFLLVVVAALFALKWWSAKDPLLVVTEKEVSARYGPSERETKAFVLHEGAEAKLLDESKDWFYVALPSHSTGWIPKSSAELI